MFIYKPYFYIIQEISTGKYYAGSKFGKDANPQKFMVEDGYITSSKTINSIINQWGLDSFIVRKVKIFESGDQAYNYETRFLRKVDAGNNKNFYNSHNNKVIPFGSPKFKELMFAKYGVEHSRHLPETLEKCKVTCLETYGVEYSFQSEIVKNKIKETNIERYGVEYPMQNLIILQKSRETNIERYGVERPLQSKDIVEKMSKSLEVVYGDGITNSSKIPGVSERVSNTMKKKYGGHTLKSPTLRKKVKETNIERYGVEYPMQLETVKEKASEARRKLSNREIVKEIRKYKEFFKFSVGIGWYQKCDEELEKILETIKSKHREI